VRTLHLTTNRTGDPLPGDERVLNFRVLACGCEASTKPVAPAAASTKWPAVVVREEPAGIDWMERLATVQPQLQEIGNPAYLHTNACDFVLMHRDHWLELRGYPEIGEPAEFQDALFCYTAHFAGVREELLPSMHVTRDPQDRPPAALDDELIWLITQMRRLHSPVITNVEGWDRGE
jgi:hypothetical protein